MRKPRPPEPRHRHHARPPSLEDGELGYRPSWDAGRWQRTPPTVRGAYPVVSREGGLWTGAIALWTQDHRGWWWSTRIAAGQDLTSLPPAPSWDEPDEPQDG